MNALSRRVLLKLGALVGTGAAIRWQLDPSGGLLFEANRALASVSVPQTWKLGNDIFKQYGFATPLPTFTQKRVGGSSVEVRMLEFQQRILPDAFYSGLARPYDRGTYVWSYAVSRGRDDNDQEDDRPGSEDAGSQDTGPQDTSSEDRGSEDRGSEDGGPSYPGRTIEAQKGRATTVKYVNELPANPVLRKYLSIDQTIHWADPLHAHGSFSPYSGPIPTVVHLHGGETQSTSDGAPDAWFTNDGLHGPGYFSLRPTDPNAAIYHYPNDQPATTLWVHDHSLGITRINVFSGLAAFYLIRDRYDTGKRNNPLRLPAGDQEIELMIQDRQFDTDGQLLFPDSAMNPSPFHGPPSNRSIHPFWIPDFFGDTFVVNGRTWPFLNVEPRRYRFRMVNACNSRIVRMGLVDAASGMVGPPIWQIGTDGGLLDAPVKLAGLPEPVNVGDPHPTSRLFLAPSERADIIIDFTGVSGRSFTLTNDCQVPFPGGAPLGSPTTPASRGDPLGTGDPMVSVMQFRVTQSLTNRDTTYDPASGRPLRGGHNQAPAIVRLVDPSSGTLAAGVVPAVTRQLVLVDAQDPFGRGQNTRGTPVEILINNSRWSGRRDGGGNVTIPGSVPDQSGQDLWMTELPRVGSTEIWEILNLSLVAHPIHIHLIQFQLLNREPLAPDPLTGLRNYSRTWSRGFGGGTYNGEQPDGSWGPGVYPPGIMIPGYGPPNDYFTRNADGALGGNPAFSPFLAGPASRIPPNPNEAGWKDVAKVFVAFVTRYAVRWAPQATPISGVQPGQNLFSFDPTRGPGYVVHCHALDHEDNEMMRPYLPVP